MSMPLSKPRAGVLLACAILACTPVVYLGMRYGAAELLGHFGCDLYQPLADGMRQGKLSLPVDAARVTIFDATLWRGDVYISHPPLPAGVYTLLDSLTALLGLGPLPKIPVFVFMGATQVLAVFFILLRLVPRGVVLPFLLALSYALTFPVAKVGLYDPGASEVSAQYTTGLLMLGLLAWLRYEDRPTSRAAALAAALLACAGLGRATTWAYSFALIGVSFLRRGMRRDLLWLGGVMGCSVVVTLLYNALRFGDPGNFGDVYSYTGVWEQAVDNHGVMPDTFGRSLARAQQALVGWFGIRPRTGADSWTLYAISENGAQLVEHANLLLVGLFAGAIGWLRAYRKPGFELALLAGIVAHIVFYMLSYQSVTSRYALDVWPCLFLISLAGLHQATRAAQQRWGGPWPTAAFLAVILLSVAFAQTGAHGLVLWFASPEREAGPIRTIRSEAVTPEELQDPEMEFCPGGIIQAERLRPEPALRCSMLEPRPDDSPPPPWEPQESLHRLGLFRQAGGRCKMLFFAGATLWQEPDRACRVELHLEPEAVTECARVELRLDGETLGPLAPLGPPRADRLVCARELPSHGAGPVHVYFLFEDGVANALRVAEESGAARGRWVPYFGTFGYGEVNMTAAPLAPGQPRPLELRGAGGYFGFHEIRISCGGLN